MEQQAAIAAVLMEVKLIHLMPSSDEWTLIEDLVGILQSFQQATEISKYPSSFKYSACLA